MGADIMQQIQNSTNGFGENVLGNIQKARLLIYVKKESEVIKKQAVGASSNNGESVPENPASGGNSAPAVKIHSSEKMRKIDNFEPTIFTVQFNPSELSIDGSGGGNRAITHFTKNKEGKNDSSVSYGSAPVNISMRVRLFFDRTNISDAFTAPNIGSITSMMTTAATNIAKLNNGSGTEGDTDSSYFSIRPQVESLIAMLRINDPIYVQFIWGEHLEYLGVPNNINARYTMFNTSGEPIRAEVDLSMLLANSQDQTISDLVGADWNDKYRNAFTPPDGKKFISLVNTSQRGEGLVNI